jgi:hypothetical protein
MSRIPLGIIASAISSEIATGGLVIDGTNGFRYHIFNSSGTFTLNQAKTIYYYMQDGGSSGVNNAGGTQTLSGGSGGAGGSLRVGSKIFETGETGQITVVVGGSGTNSSFANPAITPVTATASGGSQGIGARVLRFGGTNVYVDRLSGTGGNGVTLSLPSVWTDASISSFAPAQAGGGGGGGGASMVTDQYFTNGDMPGGSGGSRSGSSGGGASANNFVAVSGSNSSANSGGGGGGAGSFYYQPFPFDNAGAPGLGGSGKVIVAYSLT